MALARAAAGQPSCDSGVAAHKSTFHEDKFPPPPGHGIARGSLVHSYLDPAVAVLGPSVPWAPAACSAAQPQASSPCQFLSLQSEILAGRIWRCKRPAVLFSSSLKLAPVLYLPSHLLFFQSSKASTGSRHHAAASWTR
ncbi:hypothetical protein GQ55_3G408100 [Panicum hallii var. hallii]|uniref:Uncharacterized protein n=1 Tax=Panicum hallii var. hallii TaxID=1504633 RepID=A0A2T7EH25_9POAL|nr:hypothetical protein GQ55_3G408100 [Panicum hallii var. hallii]